MARKPLYTSKSNIKLIFFFKFLKFRTDTMNVDEILLAIKNRDIDILVKNRDVMIMSCIDYIPYEFWKKSQTIKKIYQITTLSSEEIDKLADIYKRSVVNSEFIPFYELNTLNKEDIIAEHIINYDNDFWENNKDAYKNLIKKLKNDFGESVINDIIKYNYCKKMINVFTNLM